MRVVVLGVGNLIMGDEGLGVRCVERLAAAGALPAGVVTIDGGTSTHELLEDLEDLDLLVIVDAIAGAGAPGTLVRLEGERIPAAFSNKLSPHQHGINDLLANLQLLGRSPARVVVHGATPARIALGLELSPEIEAVLPALAARVVAEVVAAS
ncbi:MAG: hydrogenase maturation protease [Myxococcales bacterium]|nr:hydrogenase maturation protease [Myxococcales bacterium]